MFNLGGKQLGKQLQTIKSTYMQYAQKALQEKHLTSLQKINMK